MRVLPRILAAVGVLTAALLALPAGAQAKCGPATGRLLPRPVSTMFIAVLVTCDSRMEALSAFADLSTKHPAVLASATVDVDEVNLGKKGVYYRTLVGKPGTKDAAVSTCTVFKAAGYKWCRAMKH
jgi:hypothetical protein